MSTAIQCAADRRERQILFSGPVVRATLDDRKTQTRRTRGLEQVNASPNDWACEGRVVGVGPSGDATHVGAFVFDHRSEPATRYIHCPYGVVGDHLYVREAWRLGRNLDALPWSRIPPGRLGRMEYEADGEGVIPWTNRGRYRHARFMPRRLSRITLELTGVRVERVQDISEADAIAEGMIDYDGVRDSAVDQFRDIWDSLNAKRGYGWDVNPWVWVLEFAKAAA